MPFILNLREKNKVKISFFLFLKLATRGKHYIKKKPVFLLICKQLKHFLHILQIYSSGMLLSKDLTNLIVLNVKIFEGTEFLAKCAQHLAELYQCLWICLSIESFRRQQKLSNFREHSPFNLGSKGQNWALRQGQVKATLQELSSLKQIY